MAQKITVALGDDRDGGPADETVRFGLGGTEYEFDLSTKNANAFRSQFAPFIEHAREAGRGQRHRPWRTTSRRERGADIRAWAKGQGITVSDRVRIPASVAQQYEAATQDRDSRWPDRPRPDDLWLRPTRSHAPVSPLPQ